ncbi:alpha/beta fold hydrolase [Actinomadura sp. LD22]|uniref:Alpha/beta fold hydrolase n=1 Tax=Actinomadura physcomitrii TaxID=2650748 RepID=A0A6I4MMQ7_9ACTN|nr:alpha/beta fold hydrolase [Actinomadura physcomitrii]MWA03506.1 alpha/beta fold hydrolase [Actinomadura physcomitrii]
MRYESPWQDLRGVAFAQRWVNAGGVATRVLEAGDPASPALVFIHGTGGHAEAYTRNIGPHAEHFHTYSIDMVGHGFSDKPEQTYGFLDYVEHLRAFLDAEGIEKASFSGESMGAGIAAWFALTHPDRVDRLCLNTGAALYLAPEVVQRLTRLSMAAVENPTRESVRKRLEFLVHDPSQVTDDLVETRLAIYRQPEFAKAMPAILARHTDPETQRTNVISEEQWRSLPHPTLVLWTTHDPTAPVEAGEQVAGWLPDSRFVVMEDCGHWPQFEDAATFNRVHLDFMLGR